MGALVLINLVGRVTHGDVLSVHRKGPYLHWADPGIIKYLEIEYLAKVSEIRPALAACCLSNSSPLFAEQQTAAEYQSTRSTFRAQIMSRDCCVPQGWHQRIIGRGGHRNPNVKGLIGGADPARCHITILEWAGLGLHRLKPIIICRR